MQLRNNCIFLYHNHNINKFYIINDNKFPINRYMVRYQY